MLHSGNTEMPPNIAHASSIWHLNCRIPQSLCEQANLHKESDNTRTNQCYNSLNSTKQWFNSEKASKWHTPDKCLKHVLLCVWEKCTTSVKHTHSSRHHFLHEFTLWPQLSTQRAGTEACVRAWLINYHLLGNLLLGSKQWLHRWQYQEKKTHKPLLA